MHCRQAGESLSKHNHLFSLDGLTEPSDAAAESFSKYEGDYLDIDLASSPSSAACIFSRYHRDELQASRTTATAPNRP